MELNNEFVTNFGESLLNIWTNSLDKVTDSQKEIENLLLQAFTTQKESLEKIAEGMDFIQEQQKKLIADVRDYVMQNVETVYGEQASQTFEKWYAQLDEINNRVQQLTSTPYKESLNLLNQSQEQFQQSIKNSIEQQKKTREETLNQFKIAQKGFMDLFESNTKMAFNLFK
jgi:Polyhydroxyalkanoic acid inclusion protein (PhaP_Bmeg)